MPERFTSPVSLLASFLSQEFCPELILISGDSGAGKSRWCLELLHQARHSGLAPQGVLSPPVFEAGRKVGIDLLAAGSDERRRLAWLRLDSPGDEGVFTEQWQFDPDVLSWGNQVLENIQTCDLLLIDELGPLELTRGEGLTAGLVLLDERRSRLACVVVRPALLARACQRWPWGMVIDAGAARLESARV